MLRAASLVVLLLCAAPLVSPPLHAQREIAVRHFDAEIFVRRNGSVVVTERIQLRFDGEWNGFIRTIPVRYRTPAGFGYRLILDVESVTDDAGAALRYESSREGSQRALRIWVPGAHDATRTVVIRYRVANALRFRGERDPEGARDELYWNVTGTEWEMPIEHVLARVYTPDGAAGVRAVAFTGRPGSTARDATIEMGPGLVSAVSTRPFAAGEGLTLAVAWDPGAVARPGPFILASRFLRANLFLLFPLVAFLGMFRLWSARGRDPQARPVMVQYEPPAGMTPAELGTLVDHAVDMRDVTATLVDLAVRGFLVIEEERERKMLGLKTKTEYTFHLQKPVAEWAELQPHEQRLLAALFGGSVAIPFKGISGRSSDVPQLQLLERVATAGGMGGKLGRRFLEAVKQAQEPTAAADATRTSVKLSTLQNSFYTHLDGIRTSVYDRLIGRGYYLRRPDHVKAMYVGAGILGGFLLTWLGLMTGAVLGGEPLAAVVGGVLSGLVVLGFGLFMPARTEKGAGALAAARGFREFLGRVETDRFRRMIRSPEQFEQFLPHAMAMGVEDRWAAAFEELYREPPQWYRGGAAGGFATRSFVRDLNVMSNRTSSAMSSRPSSGSSGGSGFSGGSSGGGFGGGGGRGF